MGATATVLDLRAREGRKAQIENLERQNAILSALLASVTADRDGLRSERDALKARLTAATTFPPPLAPATPAPAKESKPGPLGPFLPKIMAKRKERVTAAPAAPPAAPVPVEGKPRPPGNADVVSLARDLLAQGWIHKWTNEAGKACKREIPGGFEPNADALEALAMFADPDRFRVASGVGLAAAAQQVAFLVRRFAGGGRYLPRVK